MEKNVLMICNPIAGDVDKQPIIDAAKAFSEDKGFGFVLFETTEGDNAKAIRDLANEHKPERILIAGGDGTVKMVAEALHGHEAIFGILPAGSANGLSADLGLPKEIEENLEIAFADHVRKIDIISINKKMSLHLSDIGLNAQLIRNFEKGTLRGMMGYAMQTMTTLREATGPFGATIVANGEERQLGAAMIVIANSQKYGTGVTINPDGKIDDGKFEIVIFKRLNFWIFSQILMGKLPLSSGNMEIICTDRALITIKSKVSFQIDGEYCGEEDRLEIEIMPGEIAVAVP